MITAWWVNTQRRCPSYPCAQVVEQAAHPEHDVGPALAAGRLVVELAEPLAAGGLLGVPGADPETRQPVEDAEVALAQPFVEEHLRPRPRIASVAVSAARRYGELSTTLGRRDSSAPASHAPTASAWSAAGRGQLDVGVAHVEVELLGLRLVRRVVGLVADALAVPDEGDLLRTGGPSAD